LSPKRHVGIGGSTRSLLAASVKVDGAYKKNLRDFVL
jgi:predicted sugar kinase